MSEWKPTPEIVRSVKRMKSRIEERGPPFRFPSLKTFRDVVRWSRHFWRGGMPSFDFGLHFHTPKRLRPLLLSTLTWLYVLGGYWDMVRGRAIQPRGGIRISSLLRRR